ncbi:MAG TPA: PilZ domain-containing protein [Bacilli bacterium]|nr:PilZ domain-containing protein [Bacilli bacterium]
MGMFEGANILVSSTNYSNMGQIYFEQGELFDVVFPTASNLNIGDPVTATVYHQNGILTFQSTVIGTLEDRVLLIKPHREAGLSDRREYPRYNVELTATVNIPTKGEVAATVKDVSLGGARFESDKYLEQGQEVDVLIDAENNIEGRGIIRRVQLKDGIFHFGIEFVQTDELRKNLEEYLKRIEGTASIN